MGEAKRRGGKKREPAKMQWPEPTGPLHSGVFDLGHGWSGTVPAPMSEESKDDELILYCKGFMIRLSAHGANGWPEPREQRYAKLRAVAGQSSFKVARDRNEDPISLLALWLVAEKGPADQPLGMQAYALTDNESLVINIFFDVAEGKEWALAFVDSLRFSAAGRG